MHHKCAVAMAVIAAGILAALATDSPAGPMLPGKPATGDDVISLAGIQQFGVTVTPFQASLREIGMSAEHVRGRCIDLLEEAGYKVVKGDDQPYLSVAVRAFTNPKLDIAIHAYSLETKFLQPIELDRLDRTLEVPTYATSAYGISETENLAAHLDMLVDARIKAFIQVLQQAEDFVNAEEAGQHAR